ncbi:hypothetical protein GF324_12105, partial [bacterium]|nr:hypothetical protein [bacterium]
MRSKPFNIIVQSLFLLSLLAACSIPDAAAQGSGIVEERPDGTVVVLEN